MHVHCTFTATRVAFLRSLQWPRIATRTFNSGAYFDFIGRWDTDFNRRAGATVLSKQAGQWPAISAPLSNSKLAFRFSIPMKLASCVAVLALWTPCIAQQLTGNANEWVQHAVDNELKAEQQDTSHWMFRLWIQK